MKNQLIQRVRDANPFGACHIVVDDGNMEDDHIKFCLNQDDITPEERQLMTDLLGHTVEEREAIWEASLGNGENDETESN